MSLTQKALEKSIIQINFQPDNLILIIQTLTVLILTVALIGERQWKKILTRLTIPI